MDLDLEHVLDRTRKGQWSVHEFDWDTPLQGADHLSEQEKREMALMILFTAGLEIQAARIFELCARYVTDKTAKQIYELFGIDERRHAEAEILMARRLGTEWEDLPLATRAMFKFQDVLWQSPTRLLHEFTSTQIILFEIGLDALLIPALKEIDDPLQKEVFRRIDVDESRHLAMDYWLLQRKAEGVDIELRKPTTLQRLRMAPMMVFMPMGFVAVARNAKSMQARMRSPERVANYWNRVNHVTDKAPGAMNLKLYRMGVKMQEQMQRMMGRVSGEGAPPPGRAAAA
ncbi:MAG: hypothetical protein KDH09_17585 [Chrysiogenetes bacterium]|nr:hypothetical protein [Chrysiogenetes bacterium]